MKFITGESVKRIEVSRELSDLDKFALEFIRILEKHTDYIVVSGYVSILLGRARASEDVDVIIPEMDFNRFKLLLKAIYGGGFYCLNADHDEDVFDLIKSRLSVMFAKANMVIPNIELKFAKSRFDDLGLKEKIRIKIGPDVIFTSPLEMQVAFKEEVLRSPKDIEDARHIKNVAEGSIDENLIKKYRMMLHDFYRKK